MPCVPLFHHYLNIGFIQCQDSVHYLFPGIVDIQVHVVLRSFDGKAAVVGSGIVHGTCEEHDCGACEWLAVGVQYVSFYDTVLGYSDVIVTDLPLHHFDGIVRGCFAARAAKAIPQLIRNLFTILERIYSAIPSMGSSFKSGRSSNWLAGMGQ